MLLLDGKDKIEAYKKLQQLDYSMFSDYVISKYNRILKLNIAEVTEEFRRIYQRGRYNFYPDITLTDLASDLSGKDEYKFDTVEEVLNDLFHRGFEGTSSGVIQLLES